MEGFGAGRARTGEGLGLACLADAAAWAGAFMPAVAEAVWLVESAEAA